MKKTFARAVIVFNVGYGLIILLFLLDVFTSFDIKNQALKSFAYFGILIGTPTMLLFNLLSKRIVLICYPILFLILTIVINPFKIIFQSRVWETVTVLDKHKSGKTVEFQMQDIGALGYNRRTVEVTRLTPFFRIIKKAKDNISENSEWIYTDNNRTIHDNQNTTNNIDTSLLLEAIEFEEFSSFIPPEVYSEPEFNLSQRLQPNPEDLKPVFLKILNKSYLDAYVFYYHPEMEESAYNYNLKLGSDNNFIGATDVGLAAWGRIPKQPTEGSRLMIRAIGYEPLDIDISDAQDTIDLQLTLTPKTYECKAFISREYSRDSVYLYKISTENEQPERKTFYGECRPIYSSDGNHGDPLCAFSCLGCCYPELKGLEYILTRDLELLGKFYEYLEKHTTYSFTIDRLRKQQEIHIPNVPDKNLEPLNELILNTEWNLYLRPNDKFKMNVTMMLQCEMR